MQPRPCSGAAAAERGAEGDALQKGRRVIGLMQSAFAKQNADAMASVKRMTVQAGLRDIPNL